MKLLYFVAWMVIFAGAVAGMTVAFVKGETVVGGSIAGCAFLWVGALWKQLIDDWRQRKNDKKEGRAALFRKMEEGFRDTERLRTCIYLEQYSKELQQPKIIPAKETAV